MAAYRAMWSDFTQASATSDPRSSVLDDHATGDAVALMRYGLEQAKKDEVVSKGAPRLDPRVVSVKGDRVVVRDCVDMTNWLLYKLNGGLKNDVPGSHRQADATVRHSGGAWKVTDLYIAEAGSC
ncbi:hypothetical protein AB0J38_11580 [Streptomyces sp. NPDC050095]|uniref:hypothetical protein n=1 Tax=unclassified Streptomyces TaxID=2593676 RepID=UPI003419457D